MKREGGVQAAKSSVPDGVFMPPYAIANWDSAGNARCSKALSRLPWTLLFQVYGLCSGLTHACPASHSTA